MLPAAASWGSIPCASDTCACRPANTTSAKSACRNPESPSPAWPAGLRCCPSSKVCGWPLRPANTDTHAMRERYYDPHPSGRGARNLTRPVETILVAAVALALLVPCFWQPHIIAGDVPSHVYNAWLAGLVNRGQAPGLYLAHPLTNVLSDWALQALLLPAGRTWAERIVIGASVEIFFWGAFVFVAAA